MKIVAFLVLPVAVLGCPRKSQPATTDAAMAAPSASVAPVAVEPPCRIWYAGSARDQYDHKLGHRFVIANVGEHPLKRCEYDAYVYKSGALVTHADGFNESFDLLPQTAEHMGGQTVIEAALSHNGADAKCEFVPYHVTFKDSAPEWSAPRASETRASDTPAFVAADCAFLVAGIVDVFGYEIRSMHCANKPALLAEFKSAAENVRSSCAKDVASGQRVSHDDVSCLLRAYTAKDLDACKLKGVPFDELHKRVAEVMDRASVVCSH